MLATALLAVSCGNRNPKATVAETSADEVAASVKVLTDSILTLIDDLALKYMQADSHADLNIAEIIAGSLTEEEKLVRPDYLLEADSVKILLTKSQKVNALAILLVERPLRLAYSLPTKDTDAEIMRLCAELNHPLDLEDEKDMPLPERIRRNYEICRENGDLDYFWQFCFACQNTTLYLISNNPEPFFRVVSEEQRMAYRQRMDACVDAACALAPYDEDIARAVEICRNNDTLFANKKEADNLFRNPKASKLLFTAKRAIFADRRQELLK